MVLMPTSLMEAMDAWLSLPFGKKLSLGALPFILFYMLNCPRLKTSTKDNDLTECQVRVKMAEKQPAIEATSNAPK